MDPHQHGAPVQDPIVGMTFGNYTVKQKLGEGGMGSVYLAEHPHIGKKVALKVLHAEFASNNDVVARFFTEAKAVNDIGHPNIVDIVDYGVLTQAAGDGLVYFIMEFLPGHTLTDLVRAEAPLPPERALNIAAQVADALAASHKCSIVHRDLKPDNIMLAQRGRERDFVKLLDFGIAKLTGDQPGSRKTRTGLVMGTPAYMSPEQCEGRGNIDHRSDIYSLGIVIYEMITGRVPFYGDGYGEVLVQHLTSNPVPPTTIRAMIPPHVEKVVLKAMEKRPENRFPTMDEMVKALVDPVGYVEAHGGIAGFIGTNLVPSDTPAAPVSRMTPSPLAPMTPVPGSMAAPTSGPTTLGGSAGQVNAGGGKRTGLFIALGVGIAAVAAVAVVLATSGGGGGAAKDPGPGTAAVDPGAGTGTAKDPNKEPVANPTPPDPTPTPTPPDPTPTPTPTPPDPTPTPTGDPTGAKLGGKVAITVTSTPPGAFVTFGDEISPRGKTPVTFDVDAADAEVPLTLDLSGYNSESRTVKINAKVDLEVAMKKKAKSGGGGGAARPGGGGSTHTGGDDVMDPFAPRKR
jgi:eukaryotic-like serine/threonine-protein kinase